MPVVPHQMSGEFDQDGEQGVALETRNKTKRPPLYKVLLLNDDYTPNGICGCSLRAIF